MKLAFCRAFSHIMAHIIRTKILPTLIIIAGLGTALYLGTKTGKVDSKNRFLAAIESVKSNDSSLSFERVGTSEAMPQGAQNSSKEAQASNNLTDLLAKSYLSEVAKKNPNLAGAQTLTLPEETALQDEIASQVTNGIASKIYGRIDVRTLDNSDPSAERKYIEAFGKLTQKNFGARQDGLDVILSALLEKQNPEPLRTYLDGASAQVNDLLALETPASLVDFHIKNLNLWQKKISVYGALLDLESDPLKSYIALQSIESIVSENESLQTRLDSIVKKLNS